MNLPHHDHNSYVPLFRLTVRLRTTLVTPLAADTLFGHWCWFIRYTRGEDELSRVLERTRGGDAPFRLSSGFPRLDGDRPTLPMPVWSELPPAAPPHAKQFKRALRQPLLPFDVLIGGPVTLERVLAAVATCTRPLPNYNAQPVAHGPAVPRVRNTVNRVRGGTLESQGFFEVATLKAPPGTLFDIYFDVAQEDALRIKEDFSAMLARGFGQDASAGAGFFDFCAWEQVVFPMPRHPAWLALSPFIPAPDDPLDLVYTLTTKYGKLGGHFSFSQFNNGVPWKQPLLMMQPGAVSYSAPPKGSIITDVHPTLPVIHYALCLAVPIDLPKQTS